MPDISSSITSFPPPKDINETEIKVTTTTTQTHLYDVSTKEDFAKMGQARALGFKNLFAQKIGIINPITWIILSNSYITEEEARILKDYGNFNVIVVQESDWKKPIIIPANNYIVFMARYPQNILKDLITLKIIKKTHYIVAIGKDPILKQLFATSAIFIDVWANAQFDAGVKFPDCNKYHRISAAKVLDPDTTFIEGVDNCVCGIPGNTFSLA